MRGSHLVELPESALVERARQGDLAAFEAIVGRHYADCLRYATRMLGSQADAEEAVQDTFVRAHRALDRYDHRDKLRSWLFRILLNRCRTLARRRARARGLLARLSHLWAHGDAVIRPRSEEDSGEIERALRLLPDRQREAFLLKYLEELSYEEMAQLTGVGVSALKMRVKRACERLREILSAEEHV